MNKKIIGSSIGFLIGLVLGFFTFISVSWPDGNGNTDSVTGGVIWLMILIGCTFWGYREGKKFSK